MDDNLSFRQQQTQALSMRDEGPLSKMDGENESTTRNEPGFSEDASELHYYD